jgi:hypothetical protein
MESRTRCSIEHRNRKASCASSALPLAASSAACAGKHHLELTMAKTRRVKCDQCQLLRINGVVCHEIGCPNMPRKCKDCKREFKSSWRFADRCKRCTRELYR